ncbi:hypothetical protein KEM48_014262 [Puccinia striiformis f. sp. tritici PST-130]|nr:hypothetical protein KEM48_014262 [Puccinia striiformis f. sp. tritici PST-130]
MPPFCTNTGHRGPFLAAVPVIYDKEDLNSLAIHNKLVPVDVVHSSPRMAWAKSFPISDPCDRNQPPARSSRIWREYGVLYNLKPGLKSVPVLSVHSQPHNSSKQHIFDSRTPLARNHENFNAPLSRVNAYQVHFRQSGRFEDPLSPDVKTPTEADFIPLLEIEEFSSTEPTTLNARHQPIGLGLGIDTGESAFANFLPMATEEVFNSPPALPWGMEGSALSSGPLAILSTRRVQSSPWPASFENVTPERSQDQDLWTHRVSNDGELEIADLEPAHQSFSTPLKETSPVTPSEISPSLPANSPSSVLSTTPQRKTLRMVDDKLPLASVAPELQAIPINVISPPRETSDMPLPLSMKFSPRGRLLSTLRHRMRLRGIDYLESDQVDRTSPVLTSKSGSDAGSFTGSPSDGIISSSFGKNDSPLELPSSPAFPSPAQAMPAPPGTSTLVLSILVGSLALLEFVLFSLLWPGRRMAASPDSRRGSASTEAPLMMSLWRRRAAGQSEPSRLPSGHEDGKSMVSRSTSQAPSIPPLAYLVNGKLSIDSIRLEFPAPVSSPTTPSFISGLSSNYEEDAKITITRSSALEKSITTGHRSIIS